MNKLSASIKKYWTFLIVDNKGIWNLTAASSVSASWRLAQSIPPKFAGAELTRTYIISFTGSIVSDFFRDNCMDQKDYCGINFSDYIPYSLITRAVRL